MDVTKNPEDGSWKSGRVPANSFNTNWATDEPVDADGADCAYVAKSANYQMKTDGCTATKPFLCTPLTPNCPDGFDHVAGYKQGLSCLKVIKPQDIYPDDVTNSEISINIANQMCSDLKSRVAAPITLPDYASLKEWSDLEPDMMSSSGQLTSTMMGPIRWITDDTEANNTNIYPDRYLQYTRKIYPFLPLFKALRMCASQKLVCITDDASPLPFITF